MSPAFPTTHWSDLLTLKDGGDEEARLALSRLCELYWPPLYAFVRHRGIDAEEAKDVVQSFFLHLLEKDVLPDLDAEKGRFRSFLIVSMRNFLHNWQARDRAARRRPAGALLELDATDIERELCLASDQSSPEELYERRWALTVIEHAVRTLSAAETRAGRDREFALLRGHVVGGETASTYRDIASQLGVSVGSLRVQVHRLRRRLGEILRQQVMRTVCREGDIDEELHHLMAVVDRTSQRPPGS